MKFDEEPIKGLANADSGTPVLFQLKDGETVDTAMRPNRCTDTDDRIDEGTYKKERISIGNCVSQTQKLIRDSNKISFNSNRHSIGVYTCKTQEDLQKQKFKCMKQLTLQGMFREITNCFADNSDNSGSPCSTSMTFLVNQISINVLKFLNLHAIIFGCRGAHPASYPVAPRAFSPGAKTAVA